MNKMQIIEKISDTQLAQLQQDVASWAISEAEFDESVEQLLSRFEYDCMRLLEEKKKQVNY